MPTEVAPDVYDITLARRDGRRYRSFLFTERTPTLVDVGFEDMADSLTRGIEAVGIPPERVVITHADRDHVGGLDALASSYDVETWLPEQSDLAAADVEVTPDRRYGDGDHIGQFTAVHAPGHEPDNHVLVDEDRGIAVMGDAVAGADQRGLPAGYFHLPPAFYTQDLNQAEESLERVVEYEFDIGLVYHGSSVTENASAILDRYVHIPGL